MIEILKLFYKKFLSSKVKREYYNINFFSWKSLLLTSLIFMILVYLMFDPNLKIVQLIQVIISGVFISTLVYVATVILPERNRVDCIINIFQKDLKEAIFNGMFDEYRDEESINEQLKEHLILFSSTHIFPLLMVLEVHFGKIDRSIGIKRVLSEENGLFSIVGELKYELENLIKYLEYPVKNKDIIDKCIKDIKGYFYKLEQKKGKFENNSRVTLYCNHLKDYYYLK